MFARLLVSAALFASSLFASSFLALPVQAQTTDVAGVKFDQVMTVGGSRLVLNGAGVRYKAIFKVYAAGLYLGAKESSPEAVLAATGARRIRIVMLRDIDGNELGKLFTRGMEDNTPRAQYAKLIPGIMRMSDIFSARRKLLAGESFLLDYVPGTGSIVVINGVAAAEPIREPEFFSALLSIWLGQSPADRLLKDALLGKPAVTRDSSN